MHIVETELSILKLAFQGDCKAGEHGREARSDCDFLSKLKAHKARMRIKEQRGLVTPFSLILIYAEKIV